MASSTISFEISFSVTSSPEYRVVTGGLFPLHSAHCPEAPLSRDRRERFAELLAVSA
jgi:hypothetical protein